MVEGFCSGKRGAVLLEGLEYLSAHHGFEAAYRTLTVLRDVAAASGSVILVSLSPSTFEERERALLAKELEFLPGAGKEEAWEAASSGLFGDERALYELLRASGRGHQADLVKAAGFSKAKMTRLLDRMERKGLLRRERDGMGNLVVLS